MTYFYEIWLRMLQINWKFLHFLLIYRVRYRFGHFLLKFFRKLEFRKKIGLSLIFFSKNCTLQRNICNRRLLGFGIPSHWGWSVHCRSWHLQVWPRGANWGGGGGCQRLLCAGLADVGGFCSGVRMAPEMPEGGREKNHHFYYAQQYLF